MDRLISYINDPTFLFYGLAASLALLRAALSGRPPLLEVAIILWLDWIAWNIAIARFGFEHAPLILPCLDAMFLGFAVWPAMRDPNARVVAWLYLLAIAAWAGFIATGQQSSFACYATANGIFLAQLATVGLAGAWSAFKSGVDRLRGRRDLRPRDGVWTGLVHELRPAARKKRP